MSSLPRGARFPSAAESRLVFELLDHGRDRRHASPAEAREHLTRACTLFAARGDGMGQLLCLAFLVETIHVHGDGEHGGEAIEALVDAMRALLQAESDLRAAMDASVVLQARWTLGLMATGKDPLALRLAARRTFDLIAHAQDAEEHALAAAVLLEFHAWHPAVVPSRALWASCAPRDDEAIAPALRVAWYRQALSAGGAVGGPAPDRLDHWQRQASRLVSTHGLTRAAHLLDQVAVERHLDAGAGPMTRTLLDCMRLSRRRLRADQPHDDGLEALWYLHAGRYAEAVDHALAAHALAAECGLSPMVRAHLQVLTGFALIGAGQDADAETWFASAAARAQSFSAHEAEPRVSVPCHPVEQHLEHAYLRLSLGWPRLGPDVVLGGAPWRWLPPPRHRFRLPLPSMAPAV